MDETSVRERLASIEQSLRDLPERLREQMEARDNATRQLVSFNNNLIETLHDSVTKTNAASEALWRKVDRHTADLDASRERHLRDIEVLREKHREDIEAVMQKILEHENKAQEALLEATASAAKAHQRIGVMEKKVDRAGWLIAGAAAAGVGFTELIQAVFK